MGKLYIILFEKSTLYSKFFHIFRALIFFKVRVKSSSKAASAKVSLTEVKLGPKKTEKNTGVAQRATPTF